MTWINSFLCAHTPGPPSIEPRCKVFIYVDPGLTRVAVCQAHPDTTRLAALFPISSVEIFLYDLMSDLNR
jgi:hypothetical protein